MLIVEGLPCSFWNIWRRKLYYRMGFRGVLLLMYHFNVRYTYVLICTGLFTMLYLVSYFSATPARFFRKLLYAEKCGFNLQIFNLSTGHVAISPWPLSSHVKPWQKDVHTGVFLNAQGMNKQGIFTICSTAFRFALSCADGLTVVHLKMDLAKASSDSKKKVENQDIPVFFLC